MHIPEHLIAYDETRWMPLVEQGIWLPLLRAREKWRQAQDAWAHEHGLDRAQFEERMRLQKNATINPDDHPGGRL